MHDRSRRSRSSVNRDVGLRDTSLVCKASTNRAHLVPVFSFFSLPFFSLFLIIHCDCVARGYQLSFLDARTERLNSVRGERRFENCWRVEGKVRYIRVKSDECTSTVLPLERSVAGRQRGKRRPSLGPPIPTFRRFVDSSDTTGCCVPSGKAIIRIFI